MSCAELRIQTSCGAQAAAPQCDGKVGFVFGTGEVILKEQEIHEINITQVSGQGLALNLDPSNKLK